MFYILIYTAYELWTRRAALIRRGLPVLSPLSHCVTSPDTRCLWNAPTLFEIVLRQSFWQNPIPMAERSSFSLPTKFSPSLLPSNVAQTIPYVTWLGSNTILETILGAELRDISNDNNILVIGNVSFRSLYCVLS
jgi:hypothetical protein